jgi:hypothetical protein
MATLVFQMHRLDRRRDAQRLRAIAAEVREIAQEIGSIIGTAMAYRGLAWIAADDGDLSSARRYLGEEMARLVPLKDWGGVHGELLSLANLAARQGDYRWAGRMFGLWVWLSETTGLGDPADRAAERARLAAESGAPSEEAFAAACAEGHSMSLQQAIDYALGEEASP